jgi:hypothetical protein
MKPLYTLYQRELDKVSIANYYEQRENEKAGLPKHRWNYDLNKHHEEWLNRFVILARKMQNNGELD